jgi:ferrous iron transport protein A
MVLGLMSAGERCEIVKIGHCGTCSCGDGGHAHGEGTMTRAEEMGLRVGKRIKMLRNEGNMLLVLVDNSRIALDRRMAMKIMVRRND